MAISGLTERIRFLINRLQERLWVKPLLIGVFSVIAALVAKAADSTGLDTIVPQLSADSVGSLLTVMASSMLVIATFAVGSMVSVIVTHKTRRPRERTLTRVEPANSAGSGSREIDDNLPPESCKRRTPQAELRVVLSL